MFSSARADSASCRRCSSKLFSSLFFFFLPFLYSPALLLTSCFDFQFPPLLFFLVALLFCNLNSVFFFTFSHTVCAWDISSSATSYCCWCSWVWSIIFWSDPRGQSGWCAQWPPSWSVACRCGSRRCACHDRSCSAHIHQNVPQTCLFFFLLRSFLLVEMQLRASFVCLFCWCFLFGLLLFFVCFTRFVVNVAVARQKWKLNSLSRSVSGFYTLWELSLPTVVIREKLADRHSLARCYERLLKWTL